MDMNSDLSADEQWIIRQLVIIRSQERQLGSALAAPTAGRAEKIRAGLDKLNSRIELLERVLDPTAEHGASKPMYHIARS
jgi:hypothetical protein